MEFSKFSKQKFGENQNKTTLIGAVTGLQGMELSDAHQRAQERAASTQQDGLWDILRNSFLDKSSNDQVVDSFTGQVIQVDKPAAIGGTVKGAGKSAGAYYTNLGGSLIEGLGHLNTSIASKQDAAQISELRKANAQYQQMLDSGKKLDGTPLTEQERQSFANIISRNEWMIGEIPASTQAQEQRTMETAQKFYDAADKLEASAQTDIAQAKEGLGDLGQFAVDVGVAGTQLAGDIGFSLLTGGSALVPMAARAFGSGAQQARQSGAGYGQQLAYGLGSAALSTATEKISNVAAPFAKAFGAGAAEKLAGKLVSRFGESAAVKTMSKLAQTPAGRVAASALGEGSEEFVEAVFQPVLQRATYDPSASFDRSQAIHDMAIGAVLGGAGGAVDVAGRQTRSAQAPTAPVQSVEAQAAGVDTPAAEAPAQAPAGPVQVGRVTTIQRPYQGKTPVQTQKSAASVTVDESSVQAAQNRIDGAQGLDGAMPGKGFKATLKDAYKAVFKPAKNVPVSGVTFEGKPYTVDINSNVPGKVISDPNLTAEKLALLDILPQVVENGEYVGSGEYVQHSSKKKAAIRYDYFETPITINGADYIAKFDVEVLPMANNYRTHQITKIDLTPDGAKHPGPAPGLSRTTSSPVEGTRPLSFDSTIPQSAETVNSGDGLGAADAGFTARGMEGKERTSRLADAMPFNQYQESATGMTREDYAKLFRYQSQTEQKSVHLAEELLYMMQDGQRTFLKDVDDVQFQELVKSLDDATAWNGPQMDAAHMIQSELQGRSVNGEITSEEYVDFLRIMREHETATGQGVQANAKYSRTDNGNGQATELDAWENLQSAKGMSDQEKMDTFRRIVKWDQEIEAVQPGDTQSMKDIILDVARTRGTLSGLTGRQSRILTAIAGKSLDSMTFDQLKQFAYSSTSALSTDSNPVGAGQKIKTIQILNMLSSPTTAARNLTGNTTFYGIDALAMKGASILDMALSKLTGTRSVAYERTNREMVSAAVKAMQMSIAEITMDVDMDSGESRYGTGSNRTFKASGSFVDRVFSTLERNQAYLLNATDEFFKGAARSTEHSTQNLVNQGKIKTENKSYARDQAERLAKYRTFQDDSALSVAIQQLHDVLNILPGLGDSGKTIKGKTVHQFGAGDIVAPFTRVAGNLASRGVEYSPVNAVKGTIEMIRALANAARGKADAGAQAKAVSDTARGLTGSAIAYGFMQLALAGILRRSDDEGDEDVRALNQSEGVNGSQLNLSAAQRWMEGGSTQWQTGDTLVDLSSIEPLNLLLDMGAIMAEDESSGIVKAWDATSGAFMTATADLPVMQFIGNAATDILKYGQDPQEVIAQEAANTIVSSITPNVLRAVAEGTDDRPRYTYSGDTLLEQIVDSFKNRTPGLRQTLPGSVNPMGEEKTYQGDQTDIFLNALLNPIDVTHYQQSGVSEILEQAREETGGDTSFYPSKTAPTKLESGNMTRNLSYQERQEYLRRRGDAMTSAVLDMAKTAAYRDGTAAEKSELLNQCLDYSSQMAKRSFLGDDSVEKWVLNASNAQKDLGISTAEYITLKQQYGTKYLSGEAYEKTKEAVSNGIPLETYLDYRDDTADITADKDKNGKTIDGSKKAKVLEAIDAMDLSRTEKDWLYYLAGYSQNTIGDAPWR